VNVRGANLDSAAEALSYQLVRGATDFIRACAPEPVVREAGTLPVLQYPVRTHVIGYAPANASASLDSPPSFVTASQPLTACIDTDEEDGSFANAPCWRFFARDRSLSSADWKLVIPLRVAGADTQNAWLLGEGLRDDERPVVEDVVMYFRYRSRPIQEL
jgi:hypothetical protein